MRENHFTRPDASRNRESQGGRCNARDSIQGLSLDYFFKEGRIALRGRKRIRQYKKSCHRNGLASCINHAADVALEVTNQDGGNDSAVELTNKSPPMLVGCHRCSHDVKA